MSTCLTTKNEILWTFGDSFARGSSPAENELSVNDTMYIVTVGRVPGVYATWEQASAQVTGHPGAVYRKCTKQEALTYQFIGVLPKETHDTQRRSADPATKVRVKPIVKPRIVARGPELRNKIKPVVKPRAKPDKSVSVLTTDAERAYFAHPDYDPDSGTLYIYTDGSTIGNGKAGAIGGYGVFVGHPDLPNFKERLSGKVTNNVGELSAMVRALEFILDHAASLDQEKDLIYSIHYDSEYACGVITGKTNARKNLKLVRAGKELLSRCRGAGIRVEFRHVYSHTGATDLHSIGNDIADTLAKTI